MSFSDASWRGFVIMLIGVGTPTNLSAPDMTSLAREFVREHERQIQPLQIEAGRAWWTANISGKDEDFAAKEEAENKINEALSDKQQFQKLKALHAAKITDPALARTIAVLCLQYLDKQLDPALLRRMTAKANSIEKAFNVFRAQVGEKSLTDGEVRQVLQKSKDSAERQAVWEASKRVGAAVENDLKDLVRLRNEAAASLGFPDYHAL